MPLVNQAQTCSSASSSSSNPPSPLRPIITSTGFTFPTIWSFPPFFTLQPHPTTQTHQIELWMTLILSWARHHRIFSVNCDAVNGGDVFGNKSINRRLLPDSIREVMSTMSKNGQAAPDPPKQNTMYLVYWRKPEEWGTLLYDWVTANGLSSSIMTFYEITDGDLSDSTEFRQLPGAMLRKVLETLVKRGKVQLLRGEGEAGEGVRFL